MGTKLPVKHGSHLFSKWREIVMQRSLDNEAQAQLAVEMFDKRHDLQMAQVSIARGIGAGWDQSLAFVKERMAIAAQTVGFDNSEELVASL